MASGETPARCIKTWSPIPYGREDYLFCLWEADSAKDVESTIRSFAFSSISPSMPCRSTRSTGSRWPRQVVSQKTESAPVTTNDIAFSSCTV
jgi:hypothetical protein